MNAGKLLIALAAVVGIALSFALAQPTGTNTQSPLAGATGDFTCTSGGVCTLGNIPNDTTMAGDVLATNSAAPSSPAAGKVRIFADSTDLRFHDKNASGVIGTTVVADTGASNNFLTAISAAGAISKAQPAFTNLSGSVAAAQMPALTGDCTTSAGAVATTCTKINGTDETTAWTTFTPTITCGAGTVTSYTTQLGRYKTMGKTVWLSIAVKVNAVGTCSGAITIASLPITTGSNNQAVAVFDQTNLATLGGFVGTGLTTIQVFTAAGGNPTATDIFIVGGVIESN